MATIERFRYFLSAARNQSFTQAAKECFITQTAISQQIAQLEKEMGVALFIRENKRVRLTAAGNHLVPMAQQLLDNYDKMMTDMERIYRRSVSITVAVSGNFEAQLLSLAIPAFRQKYPHIVVLVKNIPMEDIPRSFSEGVCDLVFAITGEIRSSNVWSEEVIHGNMGVAVSVNDPLAQRESISCEELPALPIVLFREKPGLQIASPLIAWAEAHGYRGNDVLYADTVQEQQFMVSVGQCFSILAEHILSPGIKILPLTGEEIPYSISVYCHQHTRELEDLVNLLKQAGDTIIGYDRIESAPLYSERKET